MTTQNNALENIENAEKTPDPSSKIKELDDLDRFLIKAVKRAPFVAPVFFITCFLGSAFFCFALIGFFISVFTYIISGITFSKRNNKETCEYYNMLITYESSAQSPKFSDSSSSRYDWFNDPSNPSSPLSWRHHTHDRSWRNY